MKQRCGNLLGKENGFELDPLKICSIFDNLWLKFLKEDTYLHFLQVPFSKLL